MARAGGAGAGVAGLSVYRAWRAWAGVGPGLKNKNLRDSERKAPAQFKRENKRYLLHFLFIDTHYVLNFFFLKRNFIIYSYLN